MFWLGSERVKVVSSAILCDDDDGDDDDDDDDADFDDGDLAKIHQSSRVSNC